jgi:hypothetical protein
LRDAAEVLETALQASNKRFRFLVPDHFSVGAA